ncbi:MAG: hypothetical protein AAGF59_13180 [Pseudomonadota bacterium]
MEGIVSMFHPSCRIFFPLDQPPSIGHAGARQVFARFVDTRPEIQREVISEVIVGEIALLCAKWRVVNADGSVMAEGYSTEVATKLENGGWGYLIDCPYGPPDRHIDCGSGHEDCSETNQSGPGRP